MDRRFLRARRWVVLDAYKQFKETEDWREANQLDVLYDSIDLDAYEQSRRLVRGVPPAQRSRRCHLGACDIG